MIKPTTVGAGARQVDFVNVRLCVYVSLGTWCRSRASSICDYKTLGWVHSHVRMPRRYRAMKWCRNARFTFCVFTFNFAVATWLVRQNIL